MEERVEGEQMQENRAQKPSSLENGHTIDESLRELVENDEADFNTWTSLISNIEKTSRRCVESVCEVYDAFLLEFPLCHGYCKKYASYVASYCTLNEVENVYKRGVEAIPYCVDLWASYCSFGMLAYEDPADVRRLFDRGLSFVGKDYSSYLLWDKYIEFEHSQKQWSRLAYVYINALRFPTKKINDYYMSFKKLVAIGEEEMGCEKSISVDTGADREEACRKVCEQAEIRNVIRSLMTIQDGIPSPSIVKKYLSIGELLYHSSSQMVEKIKFYEDRIQRPYFHLKPLDKCQLENWHQYLDFVEKQGDFDWTVKLYERCLIPCANYSELWIRYVEFVEAKGGREIANNALTRAQKVFLKRMPAFHLYCSMFKEKIGDVDGARASFQSHRKLDPKFVENVYREANMEKRMGNAESACMVYEKAVEVAQGKQNLGILSLLYVKFAHFKFVVSNDIYAPIEVFMRGIQEVPCKYLIQEMINFIALRGGPEQIPKLDSLIADIMVPESAVSEALNFSDREEISSLFLEVVDLHGTIDEVRKAWNRHRNFFPHIMKHVVECHSTQIRDSPLARAVMGTKHIFDSNQTCGDDGHDNSRMHLLYYHSHEDDHSPPKSMEAGKLPDSVIRNKGIEELVVPEDVEKQSFNDNKGMEELVEAAENVDEQSIPEGIDEHVEVVVDEEKQHTNDEKEGEDLVEVAEDVEKKTIPGGTDELHEVVGESAHECQAAAQVPETTPESGDSLRLHVLENLSITSPQNETEQSNPPASCDHNIPNEGKPGEISSIHVSAPLDTKSSALSQDQIHKSLLHSVCESTPTGSQSNPPVEMQVHEHTTQQQAVTVSAAYSQNAGSVFTLPQMHYVQPSQSQQWQGHPQFQYPPAGTTSTKMVVTQGYPCQSQASQMASAQVYQSVQEQNYAYIQLQSSTQPPTQSQLNPQSIISNEQQYGCSQNSQGIPPHILQYYQQQCYYLQQHNQQVQNVQQYQQLLYMQQQQHQLYQQQQQQYYIQPQQIIQQQQFQQLTQQEQQLLLQQHQQQFPQQMQQQYLLLQQQHQQQLQQLQQQSTQQHQQPPVQQQQQQINGSDRKALSSPNVQGEGDNLQSAEKVWAFESSASSSKSMIV